MRTLPGLEASRKASWKRQASWYGMLGRLPGRGKLHGAVCLEGFLEEASFMVQYAWKASWRRQASWYGMLGKPLLFRRMFGVPSVYRPWFLARSDCVPRGHLEIFLASPPGRGHY